MGTIAQHPSSDAHPVERTDGRPDDDGGASVRRASPQSPMGPARALDAPGIVRMATVVVAIVLLLIVVSDGSPLARVGRATVVVALAAGGVVLTRRRAWSWPVALMVGVVGVATGAAFGIRWIAFTGLDVVALGGLLALIAGIAAVGVGLHLLAEDRRLAARLATRGAAVLAIAVGLFVVTPPLMAVNVPPVAVADDTPGDAGLPGAAVTFPADDGVALAGWYAPSRNGADVVIRHGAGRSTMASVVPVARVLVDHGYGVLLTDARGHGASEGRAMDWGWDGERDTAAAVDFLVDELGAEPGRIGVVGMSMGGEEAIGAIAADDRIGAVVAEGATARVAGDHDWLVDEYGWRGWLQRRLDDVSFGLTAVLTDAPRPDPLATSAAAAAPRPILLIAAGEVTDEPLAARHIVDTSPGNATAWVVADAGHTDGLTVAPDEWERRVTAFLDAALVDGAG